MSRIHDAVTAVLTLGDEVFILRRQPHLAAFPGYWAFPGGKLDPGDASGPLPPATLEDHPPVQIRALMRELLEEIGFDLAAALAGNDVAFITRLGEAVTPAFAPLRFRTAFYQVALRRRPQFTLDPGEIAEAAWMPAGLLRSRYARGELLVVPPTRAVIEHLAGGVSGRPVEGLDVNFDEAREIPAVEPLRGLRLLLVRSNTLPPADRTNAVLLGDAGAPRILVDPSPATDAELERLVDTLRDERLDEIFLTHHHPDHRERADRLARRLGVPLGMSADTAQRIRRREPAFLENVALRIHQEGERLTEWLGETVSLIAVPGHDEGQLALLPQGRAWCLVGDLIQGVGTVVVGGPEASMRKYFSSLQRVIDLAPAVIVPSHGAALGTTYRLEQTLAHRREREARIAQLHAAGRSPAEMVREIYVGLDTRLLPLALLNVESHLIKLREDGRL